MRRPDPLPTPPGRAKRPAPEPKAAKADAAPKAPKRKPTAAAPTPEEADQDGIETAVDVPTFDSWIHGDGSADAADASDTGVIPDVGSGDAPPAETPTSAPTSTKPRKSSQRPSAADPASVPATAASHAVAPEAEAELKLRDVWRAARARRKSLRAEVRRFTVRSRRRRMVWIVSLSALVLLVAGTVGAAYSPLFAVEKITVVGASSLDPAAIEAALKDQRGVPLAAVDDSAIKASLVTFPMIETYATEAHPPHELVVRIVERTPVGVVSSGAGYTLVDAAGVALATTPDAPEGQPIITAAGGPGSKAFVAAGLVVRSLPAEVRALVTEVSATTPHDVTLTLGGTNTEVVWGSVDDSVIKSLNLQQAMIARTPDSVSVYDVSSPGAVVVR